MNKEFIAMLNEQPYDVVFEDIFGNPIDIEVLDFNKVKVLSEKKVLTLDGDLINRVSFLERELELLQEENDKLLESLDSLENIFSSLDL